MYVEILRFVVNIYNKRNQFFLPHTYFNFALTFPPSLLIFWWFSYIHVYDTVQNKPNFLTRICTFTSRNYNYLRNYLQLTPPQLYRNCANFPLYTADKCPNPRSNCPKLYERIIAALLDKTGQNESKIHQKPPT